LEKQAALQEKRGEKKVKKELLGVRGEVHGGARVLGGKNL